MREYKLNASSAKAADILNGRITETGKYIGTFTRAEAVTAKTGTEGIEFSFTSGDGLSADFLTAWTYSATGEEYSGLKLINAIMTCMKLRGITATKKPIEKYVKDMRSKQWVDAIVYPELENRPIGVILQREEYKNASEEVKNKFNIILAFDPATSLTASEILNGIKNPAIVDRALPTIKDKVLPGSTSAGSTYPFQPAKQSSAPVPAQGFDDFDDDIPF